MTELPDLERLFDEFQLPPQDLKKLSFCGHKPRQLQNWLTSLPVTKTKDIIVVLYKLLPELNHLDVNGSQRLELLGLVRPITNQSINNLADEFLKHPLCLTESLMKMATIAQALQRHLCNGYLLCIRQLLNNGSLSSAHKKELELALYYAIHGLGQLLYRSYQLYIPRPPMLWQKLNLLYQLAKAQGCERRPIADSLLETRKGLSSEQAYTRSITLACSNTNQLRPVDTLHLFRGLEQWCSMVKLSPAQSDQQTVYWIDTASDDGPMYKSRFEKPTQSTLAINLKHLTDLIHTHRSHDDNSKISEIPLSFRQSLFVHLANCWQNKHERKYSREATSTELEVCIGLKAAHQQLLGNTSFNDFLQQDSSEEIHMDFTANMAAPATYSSAPAEEGQTSIALATDSSDGGYCLRWSKDVPKKIKTGEVILLRKPGETHWRAGTIRWSQRLNRNTYIGIQVLAEYAEASAASAKLDNGLTTPFFRTVLLKDSPSGEGIGLLTPTIPFAPRQNIELQLEQHSHQAQLVQLLLSSGIISHYSYRNTQ
ncbi:MAG: hypothetical protein AAFZ92_04260 [Pseudomonadota bacterium]